MAQVTFDHVRKVYGDGTVAVEELSLEIPDGELIVLVGPSGCGKTTALRMVAGLEEITEGEIRLDGDSVNKLPPRDRDVAMVFQTYALYPHKTIYENLSFPLKLRRLPKSEIDERVRQIARLLELEEQLPRKPRQLSGGQRQRVAMGRAMIREPRAYLMDEPLSNLDAKLRAQMRAEIGLLHKELGVTTIYVTHDQVEAMTLGDRVAVMHKGRLQQVAEPQQLYNNPANIFVGGFIGSPAMNFAEGVVERADGGYAVRLGEQALTVEPTELERHRALSGYVGKPVIVGVRPEHLQDAALASDAPQQRRLTGLIRLREALGSEMIVHFQIEAAPALAPELRELTEDVDETALLKELDHDRHVRRTAFVGRFAVETEVREGREADIVVSSGALQFFDPDTGERTGA